MSTLSLDPGNHPQRRAALAAHALREALAAVGLLEAVPECIGTVTKGRAVVRIGEIDAAAALALAMQLTRAPFPQAQASCPGRRRKWGVMTDIRLRKPTRVTLRLWGCTEDDLKRAEANARQYYFAQSWDIVEVIPSTGAPCPIPRRDPIALNQNALYDAAWAA